MKKRTLWIKFFAGFLAVLACLLTGCTTPSVETEETSGEVDTTDLGEQPSDPENILNIVKDKKSDYVIVYATNNEIYKTLADTIQARIYLTFGVRLPVEPNTKHYDREILVGFSSDREESNTVRKKVRMGSDYAVAVLGQRVILYAGSKEYSVNLIAHLQKYWFDGGAKDLVISSNENYYHVSSGNPNMDVNSFEYVEEYQNMYNTYSSIAEYRFDTWSQYSAAKDDDALVTALKERMGDAAIFQAGLSNMLYQGYIRKLNPDDYTKTAVIKNGAFCIPLPAAERIFGETVSADADGYVNVSAFCASSGDQYTLENANGLYIIVPAGVKSFASLTQKVNGYTNKQYLIRCKSFLDSPYYEEPKVNTEQNGVIIAQEDYPEFVADYTMQEYLTLYSPSIAIDEKNGQTVLYASYERATVQGSKQGAVEQSTTTVLSVSYDNGATWKEIAEVKELRWASLYVLDHKIYLFGQLDKSKAAVAKLKDSGNGFDVVTLSASRGGGAPGAVVVHNGKIYQAFAGGQVISANVTADLLKESSWTVSKYSGTDANDESMMVVGPDGAVYAVILLDAAVTDSRFGYAKILKLSNDGKTLTEVTAINGVPVKSGSYIDIGTADSFFNIRYDATSGRYYSLVSVYAFPGAKYQRNVLMLKTSTDLVNWTDVTTVLVDREMMNEMRATESNGYQYVDFQFDGNDIVMVVREATGWTNWFHDGKYIKFYRIENYRDLIP